MLRTAVFAQIAAGLRGCVVFTSSAAAAIPSPFSVLYAATKSLLSVFGASLAPELRPHGIDVLVVHPSPVASRQVLDMRPFKAWKVRIQACATVRAVLQCVPCDALIARERLLVSTASNLECVHLSAVSSISRSGGL